MHTSYKTVYHIFSAVQNILQFFHLLQQQPCYTVRTVCTSASAGHCAGTVTYSRCGTHAKRIIYSLHQFSFCYLFAAADNLCICRILCNQQLFHFFTLVCKFQNSLSARVKTG